VAVVVVLTPTHTRTATPAVQVAVQDYQLAVLQRLLEEPAVKDTEADNLLIQMLLMEAQEAVVLGTEEKTLAVPVALVLVEREYKKVYLFI
jgi:hypothetical protein